MKAYRASVLRFSREGEPGRSAVFDEDGLLVVGPDGGGTQVVKAVGPYRELKNLFSGVATEHWPGRIIAPGFVDLHNHFAQIDVIGSPAEGLLPWLENYTYREEQRFSSGDHSAKAAQFFLDELLRNGVTTTMTFSASSTESVEALFSEAQGRHMRLITGLCLMDRNAPVGVLNRAALDGSRNVTEQSLLDSEILLQRWHGMDRLGYAITPRFAPSCSDGQLRGAAELAGRYPDVWIQSHVAENRDEIAWVRQLFPTSRSYLETYADFGLLRAKAVYAHCIHFDDNDRALMRETGAAAAICPTSNLFLGSGFFDYTAANQIGFQYGLASDVGGGTSFSPLHTMLAAYYVAREGQTKQGLSLSAQHLWWQHTGGAAQALGLDGQQGRPAVGNLQVGCEADFVVLNPQATPLLARRTAQANSLEELLFAMIVLGDDRLIERTVISQALLTI
jgi:guanine deaminase